MVPIAHPRHDARVRLSSKLLGARLLAPVLLALLWVLPGCSPGDEISVRAGNTSGKIAESKGEDGEARYLVRFPGDAEPRELTREQLETVLGEEGTKQAFDPNPWFRVFNISNWGGLVWVGLGLFGQAAFFGRMLVQWLASEKSKQSVVPVSFWWLSLFGGVTLLTYFVWRRDVVGILGQVTGVFVYARNLWLIRLHRTQAAEGAAI